MIDKSIVLKTRIYNMLQEEEFKDNLDVVKEQIYHDISKDIAEGIIVKKISDEDLREEIRAYFKDFFDEDIKDFEEMSQNVTAQDYNEFGQYNEYVDNFRIVFDSLNLPPDKKEELFNAVASISNYSVYNLMLLRSVTNAIYDTLDKETSDKIFNKAIYNVENETNILIKDINEAENTGKSLKEVGDERKKKNSNVVHYDFTNIDRRLSGFKN